MMRLFIVSLFGFLCAVTTAYALTINGMPAKSASTQSAYEGEDDSSAIDLPGDAGQWQPDLQGSIGAYLQDGGVVVGTNGLFIAGQPALIVYVQRGDNLFRCVDLYTESFKPTAYVCYALKTNTYDAEQN